MQQWTEVIQSGARFSNVRTGGSKTRFPVLIVAHVIEGANAALFSARIFVATASAKHATTQFCLAFLTT